MFVLTSGDHEQLFELLFLYTLYMHIYIKRNLLEYKSELLQYISTLLQYLSAILQYVNII